MTSYLLGWRLEKRPGIIFSKLWLCRFGEPVPTYVSNCCFLLAEMELFVDVCRLHVVQSEMLFCSPQLYRLISVTQDYVLVKSIWPLFCDFHIDKVFPPTELVLTRWFYFSLPFCVNSEDSSFSLLFWCLIYVYINCSIARWLSDKITTWLCRCTGVPFIVANVSMFGLLEIWNMKTAQ